MATGKYHDWITPDALLLLSAWARDGATDPDIADKIGIGLSTLYEWKKKYPEIAEALKKNKELADIEIENSLFKRALGYEYTETIKETDGKGVTKERVLIKHMPPDAASIIFWLKNRRPAKWRDRQQADNKESIAKLDALLADINRVANAKADEKADENAAE